jgi:uncharacterized protein involved in type VI secretion and phage assembly
MADTSLFNLSIAGLGGKPSVLSFDLLEGIYGDDSLSVGFFVPGGIPKAMIGTEANFSFEFNGKKEFFNGEITECVAEESSAGTSKATIRVKTLRHSLDKKKKSAVFCNSDVRLIAKSILKKAGVLSFKCRFNFSLYIVDFKVQHNESDLVFLQRLLEEYGITEFVKHSENRSELIINDGNDFNSSDLSFVKSRLQTTDHGNFFLAYGHRPLRPGLAFEANGETYIICSCSHSGSQEAAFGIKNKKEGYTCQIAACTKQTMKSFPHSREKPKIPGVIVAKTEGFPGSFASLDHKGRYIVRMPFDDENFAMASSIPVHLAQSFAGLGCGVHFPLRGDVPVLIAFENGDIDKPVALGAIPRGLYTGPVVGANSFQNILRTVSGMETIFDDSTCSLSVKAPRNISTKAGDTLTSEGKKMNFLKTEKEVKLFMNEKKGNLGMITSGNMSIQVIKAKNAKQEKDKTKGNMRIKAPKMISVKSDEELFLEGKKRATLKVGKTRLGFCDSGQSINMGAKENVSINASKNLVLEGKRKSVIKTEGGIKITMDNATKSLKIEAPGNITIKAGGRLVLKGKMVEIN